MSGKLPIDRVREARDAPEIYEDNRERLTQKEAKLDQTDELAEGEQSPEPTALGPTDVERTGSERPKRPSREKTPSK
jgi:hypothetical protein